MKKIYAFIYLVFFSHFSLYAQQHPNTDFENWSLDSEYDFYNPDSWFTFNLCTDLSGPTNCFIATERITDAQSGSYAAMIMTKKDNSGTTEAGFIGSFDEVNTLFGIPYNARPKSLTGYFKYNREGGDSATINILLWGAGGEEDTIGFGTLYITQDQPAFAPFTLPITYKDDRVPERLFIAVFSSENQATEGTYIVVDNFKLQETVSSITNFKVEEDLMIFPVPAHDIISINTEGDIFSVKIYNASGEIAQEYFDSGPYEISALKSGGYVVELITSKGLYRRKFIKR